MKRDELPDMDFAQRFRGVCKDLHMTKQTEIAEYLDLSKSLICSYWNCMKKPSTAQATRICPKLGCTVEWLLTGRGDKVPRVTSAPPLIGAELLDPSQRIAVQAIIDGFLVIKRSQKDGNNNT